MVLGRTSERSPIRQRTRRRFDRERDAQAAKDADETGTTTRPEEEFAGRSPFTPLELFLQKDRTTPRRGTAGEVLEQGKATLGAVGEVFNEASSVIRRATDPFTTPIADRIRSEAQEVVDVFEGHGFGDLDDDKEEKTEAEAEAAKAAIETEQRAKLAKKTELERIDDLAARGGLIAVDQHTVDQLREGLAVELAQIENDLLRLDLRLRAEDFFFETGIEDLGLEGHVDLDPLRDALDSEGDLGAQTHAAIIGIAENAALSEQQRDEAIDLVLARQNFSEELIKAVNDMVLTKNDTEKLNNLSDIELLKAADETFNPTVAFDVQGATDTERFVNDMLNDADIFLEQNVPHTFLDDDPTFDDLGAIMLTVMQGGREALADPEVAGAISDLASAWQIDEADMIDMFSHAHSVATANKDAWDEVIDDKATQARPFSGQLVAALWQAGETMGYEPELLEMASKSRGLHHIINLKSQGRSGTSTDGTIAGIGGLTQNMYVFLMGQEWTPQQGMLWELQALLKYIQVEWRGDVHAAVNAHILDGDWGGTESPNRVATPSAQTTPQQTGVRPGGGEATRAQFEREFQSLVISQIPPTEEQLLRFENMQLPVERLNLPAESR